MNPPVAEQDETAVALNWRSWVPVSVMMLCSWLSYVDRQALVVLSPVILAQTGLTTETYAQVVAAFSVAYMIGNPVWGAILDAIGLRAGMFIGVAVWTLASASHALLDSFFGFALARIVLGFGEGATFPGGLRTSTESLPARLQARGLALAYSGGALGGIVTPLMVVPIAVTFGWRMAFITTGVLGVLWLVLWYFTARPPLLNLPPPVRPVRIQWPDLRETRVWSLVASYGLGAGALGPVLYLSPLYLNRVLGFSQADLGKVLWIPPFGMETGYAVWGWVTDRFLARHSRPTALFLTLAVLSLPLALVTQAGTAGALFLFFWAEFTAAGFVIVSVRSAVRTFSRSQTGVVAGVGAGSWSALNACIMPTLGTWFARGDYTLTFAAVSTIPLIGTLIWMALSRRLRYSTGN